MEKTVEDNILLSEFMGQEFISKEAFISKYPKDFLKASDCYKCFHNSWDWLMLVVDKIETLETQYRRTFTIAMYLDDVSIFEHALTTNEIVFTEGQGRFKNLYNACIQFVKWYNENK